MKRTLFILAVVICSSAALSACHKSTGKSVVQVAMKDDPGDYQQVNVNVIGVEAHVASGWVPFPVQPGIYNLLDLQDGVTVMLNPGTTIPAGHMDQMRLILGQDNTIMIDSTLLPLDTPSAQQSGLKINVDYNFHDGDQYQILLDFDAGQSIVDKGNGTYSLKPVLRVDQIVQL